MMTYAGGTFTSAGGAAAAKVAKWDGAAWTAIATQFTGQVRTLAVDGADNLYLGGQVSSINGTSFANVAKWNGTAWSALNLGMDSNVNALAFASSGNLYAGGEFLTADNLPANYIAYYRSNMWGVIGPAGYSPNETLSDLYWDGKGDLYAGGWFSQVGATKTQTIARFDGLAWTDLGGLEGAVNAMLEGADGNLYAGGTFSGIGSITTGYIARYDPSADGGAGDWFPLGSGVNGWVYALAKDSLGHIYAGGSFTYADIVNSPGVAMWDPAASGGGGAWSSLGSGINNHVWALAVDSQDRLYAGGVFQNAGGVPANRVAMWDPAASGGAGAWKALGSGVDGSVYSLVVDGQDRLLVGGNFSNAGGQPAQYLALWDPAANAGAGAWSAWPTELNGSVRQIALAGDGSLFAVGEFTASGSQQLNHIAHWNGSTWEPLGSGLNNTAYDLAVAGPRELFVGGEFTRAGGKRSQFIGHWIGKYKVFLPVILR